MLNPLLWYIRNVMNWKLIVLLSVAMLCATLLLIFLPEKNLANREKEIVVRHMERQEQQRQQPRVVTPHPPNPVISPKGGFSSLIGTIDVKSGAPEEEKPAE